MKKTKYVNAGIESKWDALNRLINGEVFYFGEDKQGKHEITFDHTKIDFAESPFLYGGDPLGGVLSYYSDWLTKREIKWYEDIPPKGVLCWTSCGLRIIVRFRQNEFTTFIADDGSCYGDARPVAMEDLKFLLLENQQES